MLGFRAALRKARSLAGLLVRRILFPLLDRVVPVNEHLWCFCTWDRHYHTLDNPRAVFEAIKDDPSITKIVLQKTRGRDGSVEDGTNVKFVYGESLAGAYYLARSRVVLLGYALRGMTSYSQWLTTKHLVVQLWHGIPLRRVGRLFSREQWWESETPKYSAAVCSTEREGDHLAAAFAPIQRDRIWLTGLPRNDFILQDESTLPRDYRAHLAGLRGELRGRKLVLYAPTWRDRETDLYVFSREEKERLEPLLNRHQAVLAVRGHANVRQFGGYVDDHVSSAVISLNDIPDVNVILRKTDVLITDYSSIYMDFLLTGRPIIHFAYDFNAYTRDRGGFLYDLDEAFAGPVATRFVDLLRLLEIALSQGVSDENRYVRAKKLFHHHGDHSGSEVAERIRQLVQSSGPAGRRVS